MTLTVTFALGTDPDKAQQLVQNRVSQAEPRLPEEVRRLGVTTVKSSPDLLMVVHLLSPDSRYDVTYLRNYAALNVKDRLARIRGRRPDPAVGIGRLLHAGLARSSEDRRTWSLCERCCQRDPRTEHSGGCGRCGRFAWPSGPRLQLSINAQGRLHDEEQFGDIIVKTGATGRSPACATSPASSSARPTTPCGLS